MTKKKKKPIPKGKKPLDKNLFDLAGSMNNSYKNYTPGQFKLSTPELSSNPYKNSLSPNNENPFNLDLLGNTNNAANNSVSSKISEAAVTGAVASGVTGTADLVKTVDDMSKIADTSGYRNQLDNIGNSTYSYGSTNDVLQSFNNIDEGIPKVLTLEDLAGSQKDQNKAVFGAMGKGASTGASIGSAFGPVGSLIGGAIGGIAGSFAGNIATMKKNIEAEKELKELQEKRELAIAQRNSSANIGLSNYLADKAKQDLINIGAYGGTLNTYNDGGSLFGNFDNGITIINEGGSHESNPYEGIQVGIDPEGIPNLVEEGEVIWNDYVFSDRLKVPDAVRYKYKLRGNKETTFADSAKEIQKMSEEMPNDPIVKRTMEVRLNELMQEQEMVRQKKNKNKENNQYSWGGYKRYLERNGITLGDGVTKDTYKNQDNFKDFKDYIQNRNSDIASLSMQAAPIFGSLAAVINDNSGRNEPDYTNVDKYETAINEAYKPIEARTLSDYIEYNPYDISFGLNKLSASQAASRRALANTTNNPTALRAAILASDYNYGNQIGEELRRAQEYNDANRRMVADFNRATNQYNAQAINAANQFNAQQAANKATALGQVAQWRDQIYNANRAEKSGNLTGLYEGIAGLGETFMNLKDRRYLMDNGILVTPEGKMVNANPLKMSVGDIQNLINNLSAEDKALLSITANGGKIRRIKNKRRLS